MDVFKAILAIVNEMTQAMGRSPLSNEQTVLHFEPLLARGIRDGILAGWLNAAQALIPKGMPDIPMQLPLLTPPFGPATQGAPQVEPVVRLPIIEIAANDLYQKGIMSQADFNQLDQEAKRTAFTIARVGSLDAIDRIRNELASNIQTGGTLRDFQQRAREAIGSSVLSPSQLEAIYRTQEAQAYSAGQQKVLENPMVSDHFPYVLWTSTHDSRTRKSHLQMETFGQNGTAVYRRDDPIWQTLWPPAGWNCFLPDTQIEGEIEVASRSYYSGKVVEITTRHGHTLRVTANHPILTPNGFVPARTLQKMDDVIGYKRGVENGFSSNGFSKLIGGSSWANQPWLFSPNDNKEKGPFTAKDVFDSFANSFQIASFPLAANDLHCDAIFTNGKIDVVSPQSHLLNDRFSTQDQFIGNRLLSLMHRSLLSLSGSSHFASDLMRIFLSSSLLPGFPALANNQSRISLDGLPFDGFRFGLTSKKNPRAKKSFRQSHSTDSSLSAQLCYRFSEFISVDQIVEIRDFRWSGHVYDFQTKEGWLSANGIISSNCRCDLIPLTVRSAARHGSKEAMLWLQTGVEPMEKDWVSPPYPITLPPNWPGTKQIASVV